MRPRRAAPSCCVPAALVNLLPGHPSLRSLSTPIRKPAGGKERIWRPRLGARMGEWQIVCAGRHGHLIRRKKRNPP